MTQELKGFLEQRTRGLRPDAGPGAAAAGYVRLLEELALRDCLTGLANRHILEFELEQRLATLRRYGAPFGVVLLDLDNFKAVNDRYGHPAGDQLLQAVASSLRSSVREADLPGRWGGEEFLVIAAFADCAGLAALAERVCRRIEATTAVVGRARPRTTCSIGATPCRETDDRQSLVGRADHLLYESKTRGKNCITCE
ncbi:MAG: GGDEF domain-containing protein [Candidatus Bipolaricaulota bacterium]|jgi:diguanylate cyclase (GGDEF)-like protein|nr:GGDEF domain-containing protein [Candidatus Bipolaricaulota bacterium]